MKIRTWILAGIVLLLSSAPSEATILYETLEDMSQEAKVIIPKPEEEVSEWKAPEPLTLSEIGLSGVLPQGCRAGESLRMASLPCGRGRGRLLLDGTQQAGVGCAGQN